MKLNSKRTVFVGFAFFLICAFWQVYDAIVPLILTNRFALDQTLSGVVMALDNVFALFMLPLFGGISDKVKTPFGRRTPFIFFGTLAGAVFLSLLGVMTSLFGFMAILLCALISMATFRSPAVALMPDVTPKPLRSKGNAVINLMGTAGGIIALVLGTVFKTSEPGKTEFFGYLITVSGIMLLALAVFILTVKEPKWAEEADRINASQEADSEPSDATGKKLSRAQFSSLVFILASVALWFMGYNAVTSKFTVYATNVLGVSFNSTLLVAQGAAIVSYIPVGIAASKIGRKKSILAGIVLLSAAFGLAGLVKADTPAFLMYLLFALAGIGWATINVNSFPMVVELASGADVGKYTGYYYTASMAAQIATPVLSGFFLDTVGWWTFFPYAVIFTSLSFLTMCFVRHGDSKPEAKINIEAFDTDD